MRSNSSASKPNLVLESGT